MEKTTIKTINNSGLRIITHRIPDAPAVSLKIFVHTGSRYEDSTNAGVAHFFEHMVFKGTKKRPSPHQVTYDLEMIGADVNAATGREYTVYYIKVLKSNLDKGFEILSDAFLNSLILEEEVDKERNVIKEEIKMYEDDPSEYADDSFVENLYPSDQFGRNIAGTVAGMDQLTSETIKNFYNKNYFNENTVIVASGDLEHKELEDLISRYFVGYKSGKIEQKPFVADKFKEKISVYKKDIQQAQLRIGTYSTPYKDTNRYKISTAVKILGAGFGSKLFMEVREKRGLVYSIYAYDLHWSNSGYVSIEAGLMPQNVDLVTSICHDEISKLADGKIEDIDLQRAKEQYKASLLMNLDNVESWSSFIGYSESVYDQILEVDEIIKSIDSVTKDDVQKVMQELNNAEWHTTIVQGENL